MMALGIIDLKSATAANAVALVSALIAAAALVISIRAQRANYALARKIADQAGHLRAVVPLSGQNDPPIGCGFKIINGPDEVTVSGAYLVITYCTASPGDTFREIMFDGARYRIIIPSRLFNSLGFSGPQLGFRLPAYGEAEWRTPYATFPTEYRSDRGRKSQHLQFEFTVTASGTTMTSDKYSFGLRRRPIFGYVRRYDLELFLEREIDDYNFPEGLRNWLLQVMASASSATESESGVSQKDS
jgi:hypothetical protein